MEMNEEEICDDDDWLDAQINRRGITRLCHFTAMQNLESILEYELWDRENLERSRLPFRSNDAERNDQQKSHLCLSIEYPNVLLLSKFLMDVKLSNDFVVLCVDPKDMGRAGTIFTPVNAATGGVPKVGGFKGFQQLFRDSVDGANGTRWPRMARQPNCPTSIQAEVLVPGPIAISSILGIVVREEPAALKVTQILSHRGHDLPVVVEPRFFNSGLIGIIEVGGSIGLPGISVG